MSQNPTRESSARYAIKRLRTDLIQPAHPHFLPDGTARKRNRKAVHWRGMSNLAIEAEFMKVLSHPNIVKMRVCVCVGRSGRPVGPI